MLRAAIMQLTKVAGGPTAAPMASVTALLRRAPLLPPLPPPAAHAATAACVLGRRPALGTALRSSFATAAPSSILAQEIGNLRPQAYAGATEEPAVIHEVDWSANNANYISMIGTLGRDPIVRDLATGSVVANLNMAYKNTQKLTEWYTVEAWGRWAEAIRNSTLSKGQQVLVEGRLKMDRWTDRETGVERIAPKIVANQISIVRSYNGPQAPQQQGDWSAPSAQPPPPGGEWGADDQTVGAYGGPGLPLQQAPQQQQAPPQQPQYGQTPAAAPPMQGMAGGNAAKDAAWEAYFANPANFWDNRARKTNPKAPDFKNKTTNEALWLNGAPAWVHAELAALEGNQQHGVMDDNPPF